MGLICEYFAAGSDSDAAETVDWTAGPSQPPGRDASQARQTVSMPGVEPVVMLRSLEAILTSQPLGELPLGTTTPVAIRGAGERLILPVSRNLTTVLAAVDDAQLMQAALVWSETPEFAGRADRSSLGNALLALASLARAARRRGEEVYCWMAV